MIEDILQHNATCVLFQLSMKVFNGEADIEDYEIQILHYVDLYKITRMEVLDNLQEVKLYMMMNPIAEFIRYTNLLH